MQRIHNWQLAADVEFVETIALTTTIILTIINQ